MARAVVAVRYGGPEVLELVERDLPAPGPGQVALEVRAIGTNPIDLKRIAGQRGHDPADLPLPVGFEVAGVVTAVGAGAAGPLGPVSVGDEVIAFRVDGGYADALLVDGSTVLPKPSSMSFEQAAGLMLTGVTAAHCLHVVGTAGTLLVHGASGGVGVAVLQLARDAGARVVGTCSEASADLVRRFGGIPVAYGDGLEQRVRDLVGRVDAAVDCVGTDEAVDVSLAMVDRERFVTIASPSRHASDGVAYVGGGPGADPGTAVRDAARENLVRLVTAGRYEVVVAAAYPLTEARQALELLAGGHAGGKVVLTP